MKNLIITGGSGFIGQYLNRDLNDKYNIYNISKSQGVDIIDLDSIMKLNVKADTIIHTAAVSSDDIDACFQTNVVGTLNVCKYAKERGIKHIILISSIFAFDAADNGYFNSYGRTKKHSEEIAQLFCQENNIELTTLRLAQVYDDKGLAKEGQAMLYYFVDTIQNSGKISIFGRRNPLRNYIHIDYLLDVIQEVLNKEVFGVFNVVEEKSHTITEIAYILFDILKKEPSITLLPDKPDIPSVHIPTDNCYKSNITPISLRDGLQRIVNYE